MYCCGPRVDFYRLCFSRGLQLAHKKLVKREMHTGSSEQMIFSADQVTSALPWLHAFA